MYEIVLVDNSTHWKIRGIEENGDTYVLDSAACARAHTWRPDTSSRWVWIWRWAFFFIMYLFADGLFVYARYNFLFLSLAANTFRLFIRQESKWSVDDEHMKLSPVSDWSSPSPSSSSAIWNCRIFLRNCHSLMTCFGWIVRCAMIHACASARADTLTSNSRVRQRRRNA